MFLKNKNIIFKIRRSKVTDYAALTIFQDLDKHFSPCFILSFTFIILQTPLYVIIIRFVCMHIYYVGVPRDITPLLATLSRKHLGTLSSLDPRFMYAWQRPGLPELPK